MFNSNNSTPFSMPVAPIGYGNGGGFGGGWGDDWIALIVLAMVFGYGGFGMGGMGGMGMFLPFMFGGFNGFGGGNCNDNNNAIQAAVQRGFDNQTVVTKLDGLNSGLCSLGYDQLAQMNNLGMAVANGFHGVDNAVCALGYQTQQGFAGVDNAICNLGYNVQQGFNNANVVALQNQNALQAQLSQCCCDNRVGQMQLGNSMERGFCDTNYNAATNTTAIIQNAHNDTDRVLAKLDAMEMSRKDETIADLRTKLAACGDQTTAQYIINQLSNVINPKAVPAYPAASPCGLGNWSPQVLANGWNGGCGCNSGCC